MDVLRPAHTYDGFAWGARRKGKLNEDMVTLVLPTERETFANYTGLQTVRESMRLIR